MLYIHLFGHLRLFDQERPYTARIPRRFHSLWAYLLLNRGKPIQRDQLAYLLSPDTSERQAIARLRRSLHEFQHVLPPSSSQPWLLLDPGTVQWNPAADYWLDVAEFERLSTSTDHLSKSIALYTGDLLVNLYDGWLLIERQRLRNQYLANLRKLSVASITNYDYPQAILYLQQILAHEPLSEDVLAELIQLHYLAGNRAGALQAYQRFERLLKKELGVAPMPETQALRETIHQNKVLNLRLSGLHQVPRAERPTNLPRALNSFYGRSQELLHLQRLLTTLAPAQRLVTITGVAGSGKTRLALETAACLLTDPKYTFPDGIFFVDLAPAFQPEDTLDAISQALNLRRDESRSLCDQLTDFLRHRHLLLVLDNFEQVVEAGSLMTNLLAAAPNLHMLITSRVALRVYGEYEFALQPLPLPNPEEKLTTAGLLENPAVALFLARAAEHSAPITLDDANAPIIAEICIRLDGLPLAIELAANRARLFSPAAIANHLKDRLSFLANGARNLPPRQQSLRSAIEWSYDLLDECEKSIFNALGVFAGHWTPQAAQEVCGCFAGEDMLATLDNLAAQSLIYLHSRGEPPRFGMVSILREYALERLQAQGLLDAMRQRHANHYIQLVEEASDEQHDPDLGWIQYLQNEIPNLHAALSWCMETPSDLARIELGVRLSINLKVFWGVVNQLQSGMDWYQRQLPYRQHLPPKLQIKLLNAAGSCAQFLNRFGDAELLFQEALVLAQAIAEPTLESICLYYLGTSAGRQGDYAQARRLLERCIEIERAQNAEKMNWQIALAYNNLAIVLNHLEEYAQASQLLQETLVYHREHANEHCVASALNNLGNLAIQQGHTAEADAALRGSIAIRHKLGDLAGIVICLDTIASLARLRRQHIRATRLFACHQILLQNLEVWLTAENLAENQNSIASLRAELGELDFAAAWAEGQSMTIEKAVAYALETSTPAEGQNRAQGNTPEFPPERLDDDAAARWLETWWHPQGLKCPDCGNAQARPFRTTRKSGLAIYHCRQCRKTYTLYSNTPLQGSHLRPSEVVRLLRRLDEGENITGLAHSLGISWRTAQKLSQALKLEQRSIKV